MTIILDDKRQTFRLPIAVVYKYRRIDSEDMDRLRRNLASGDFMKKDCDKLLFAAEEFSDVVSLSLGGIVFYASEDLPIKSICIVELNPEGYLEKMHAVCSVLSCTLDRQHKKKILPMYRIRAKFEFFAMQDEKVLNSILEQELVARTRL